MIEFVEYNSYQSSIRITLFDDVYSTICRSPTSKFEIGDIALIRP